MDNYASQSLAGRGVLLIGRRDVEKLLTLSEALAAVELAFKLESEGKTVMPPKLYLDLPRFGGDFRAMPAYIDGMAGLKWVSVYPGNRRRNVPTVMAAIVLNDPADGRLLAIMDGTYLTGLRTGAAGGVAVKYLARKDSSVVGIIGTGTQARTQLLAICEVVPGIKEVKAFDQDEAAGRRFTGEMEAQLKLNVHLATTVAEAAEADIIVTTTPSRKPVVEKQWVRPGTHINAIGADAKGKQELDPGLLKSAKVIVDNIQQSFHSGEINVPFSKGLIKVEDIYGTLGGVVSGIKKGRENDDDITVFDSTGLAVQDVICAKIVYQKAREAGFPEFYLS